MNIRPATEKDAQALSDIYNPYILATHITAEATPVTPEEFAGRIRKVLEGGYPYLVAEDGERILGYAYAGAFRPRVCYHHTAEAAIYLDQKAAGRGIGTLLYGTLLAELQRLGFHAVIGVIPIPNPASEALQKKMGFKKVAHFSEVVHKFDRWFDVGYWELILENQE